MLAANLIPTTLAGHPFWSLPKEERAAQQTQFLKNLGPAGRPAAGRRDTEGQPGLKYRTTHAVDRSQRRVKRAVRTARREAKIAAMSAAGGSAAGARVTFPAPPALNRSGPRDWPEPSRLARGERHGGRAMTAMVERARRQMSARRSIVVVLACVAVARRGRPPSFIGTGSAGSRLDRAAVRSWLEGDGLYAYRDPISHLGAALPPAAAFLLVARVFLPLGLAGWLTALAGLAALVLALIALVGPVARRYGRRRGPSCWWPSCSP